MNLNRDMDVDICLYENFSYLSRSYLVAGQNFDPVKKEVLRFDRNYSKTSFKSVVIFCLLRCGDIQTNPGTFTKYTGDLKKNISQRETTKISLHGL